MLFDMEAGRGKDTKVEGEYIVRGWGITAAVYMGYS